MIRILTIKSRVPKFNLWRSWSTTPLIDCNLLGWTCMQSWPRMLQNFPIYCRYVFTAASMKLLKHIDLKTASSEFVLTARKQIFLGECESVASSSHVLGTGYPALCLRHRGSYEVDRFWTTTVQPVGLSSNRKVWVSGKERDELINVVTYIQLKVYW